jgi:recombination protein RecT
MQNRGSERHKISDLNKIKTGGKHMGNNLPATQKAANIRALLEQSKKQMAMALPKHLTADRLLRVAMTSIQKNPKLLDCTQQSLLACVMTCAQLGLEPDQFLGQAYLVPFKDTKKDITICTLIPGYRGYIALARRSGEVQSVSSQVVYSNDHFILQYGIEEKLEHVPADGDRGEVKGAYVVFRYKDGSYSFDYMSKGDIDKIRKRSKAANDGPWVSDYDEMAKKTVIKRHVKLAPLSVEFAHAVALEDRANMGESQADLLGIDNGDVIDAEPGDDTATLIKAFDDSIPKGINETILNEFLTRTADSNKTTVDQVKLEGGKATEKFWKIYSAYEKQQKAKQEEKKEPAAVPNPKTTDFVPGPDPAQLISVGLAPAPCPDDPKTIYLRKHCEVCPKFVGCPVWG